MNAASICLPCNPVMLVGYLCQPGLPYLLSPWESYTLMAHLSSLHWSLRTLMMTSSSSHNHLSSPLWCFCPFVILSSTAAEIFLHEFRVIWEYLCFHMHVSYKCQSQGLNQLLCQPQVATHGTAVFY